VSLRWKGDLPLNLTRLDPYVIKRMNAAVVAYAPRVEKYMKTNARWTDRTGNARNGLFSRHELGAEPRIIFGHSVAYGIFLEVRFSGAYAIVVPALEYHAPRFMSYAARIIFVDRTIRSGDE
jgi:hypothetical protein